MQSYHFIPLITKPTCYPVSSDSPSLLDHIWINKITDCSYSVVDSSVTDHSSVYLHIPNTPNNRTPEFKKFHFDLLMTSA